MWHGVQHDGEITAYQRIEIQPFLTGERWYCLILAAFYCLNLTLKLANVGSTS